MYYFLAHKLLSLGGDKDKLKTIADNTFLLALDGDVDFQPSALRLLVDRMKRNPHVGAACGRIHPIGSGAYFLFLEKKNVLSRGSPRLFFTYVKGSIRKFTTEASGCRNTCRRNDTPINMPI